MKSLIGRRDEIDPVEGPDRLGAYKEGRLDERRGADHVVSEPRATKADIDEAYDRGRVDGRRRRGGGFGLIGLLLLVVLVVGGVMLYLAARNGSFSSGGAVVDRNIATVTQKAQAPIRSAADKTGNALQNAGQDLKQRAGSGQQ
jgi:hypothetical protein